MKRALLFTLLLILVSACARLPEIRPEAPAGGVDADTDCPDIFPRGRWQLLHAIEATVPGGDKHTLTGVSILSTEERTIECALMTVEGFVLFSGRYDGRLSVERAVPPFDRRGFAQGLVDDLRLLFFPPQGPPCRSGRTVDGERICRYCLGDQVFDMIEKTDQGWSARVYSETNRRVRSVDAGTAVAVAGSRFAERITLVRHGLLGYRLDLTLLDATPLDGLEPSRNDQP